MDEALIQEQERQLQKTGRYYRHVFWLCVPLLCMACYFYGARPLLLCGIALLTGNLCDRLVWWRCCAIGCTPIKISPTRVSA